VYDNKGNIDSIPHTAAGYIDTSFYGDEYEAGYAALYDNDAVYVAGKAGDKNQNDFLLLKAILETTPAEKINLCCGLFFESLSQSCARFDNR
jgi:hypothetical protein